MQHERNEDHAHEREGWLRGRRGGLVAPEAPRVRAARECAGRVCAQQESVLDACGAWGRRGGCGGRGRGAGARNSFSWALCACRLAPVCSPRPGRGKAMFRGAGGAGGCGRKRNVRCVVSEIIFTAGLQGRALSMLLGWPEKQVSALPEHSNGKLRGEDKAKRRQGVGGGGGLAWPRGVLLFFTARAPSPASWAGSPGRTQPLRERPEQRRRGASWREGWEKEESV